MKKKIGVDSKGAYLWKLSPKGNYFKEFEGVVIAVRTPRELVVETLSTLVDLLQNHPELSIEIQDRLKF